MISEEENQLQDIFPYPKTKELVKLLAKLSTKDDDIILDFFSGSATTAQAIMELNAADGMEVNTVKQYGFVSQLQRKEKRIVLIVKPFLKRL